MRKIVSEQLPNDGSYHIKRLAKQANTRLNRIGKRGKRAKIVAKKSSLSLQFTFHDGNGNSQKNVGLGAIPISVNGISEAEKIAQMVTNQLTANTFTWEWFDSLIGKDTSEKNKQLSCREMLIEYKKYYLKQRKDTKSPEANWYINCKNIENIIENLDKPISVSLIKQIIECTENNSISRKNTLNGLVGFLKYFDNHDYKKLIKEYKSCNNPKSKQRNVPSDERIINVYETGFKPKPKTNKRYLYRYPQWKFLYGLLATYGLRIHEAWNIANWDKPVTLKNNDWVTIEADCDNDIEIQRNGDNLIIPAILDPDNKDYVLCIKHNTKTGYRMVIALSPEGHNWIEEFNLLQPLNLPDFKNPLEKRGETRSSSICSPKVCGWFSKQGYNFTPHDLRHAFNHRGYQLGFNPKALADSLGHSITMSSTTYLKHMSDTVKLKGMLDAVSKQQDKRSENEILREENKVLKAENELLKTKLKMYEAINTIDN